MCVDSINKKCLFYFAAHLDDCPEELLSDRYIKFDEVHLISAKDQIAIDDVKQSIRKTLDKHAEQAIDDNSTILNRSWSIFSTV